MSVPSKNSILIREISREETIVEMDRDFLLSKKALSSSGLPLSKEPTLGELYEDFSIDVYEESFKRELDRALAINEECLANSLAGLDKHSTYSKIFLSYRDSTPGTSKSYRQPFLTSFSAFELIKMKEYSDLLAKVIYSFYLKKAKLVFQDLPKERALEYLFITPSIYPSADYKFSEEGILPLGLPTAFSLKGFRELNIFERFYYLAYQAYASMSFRNEPTQYLVGSIALSSLMKERFLGLFNKGFESLTTGRQETAPLPDKSYYLVAAYALFEIIQETEEALERLEKNFASLYEDIEGYVGGLLPDNSIDPVHREAFIEFFSESNKDLIRVIDTLRNLVTPAEGNSLYGRLGFFELGQALVAYYKVCSSIVSIEESFEGSRSLPSIKEQKILKSLRASKELILSRDLSRTEISHFLGDSVRGLSEKEFVENFLERYWLMPVVEISSNWDLYESVEVAKDDCIQEIYKHSDPLGSAIKALKEALDDEELREELSLYATV